MPSRLVVLAFDAMEPSLVARWSGDGSLPRFADLVSTATAITLSNPMGYLPDALWPEIATGRSGGSVGFYRIPRQLFAGEARPRLVRVGEVDLTAVWEHASKAGRRVAVLDVPWAAPTAGVNGVHLWGWGTHDQPFGTGSDPVSFVDEVWLRVGDYPLPHHGDARARCDRHDGSAHSYRVLLDAVCRGIEAKSHLARSVLDEGEWDLFFAVFSEAHCVGHHFWHFWDEASPWHDRSAPDRLKGALHEAYLRLDRALEHVLEGAGADSRLMVLFSHGMGPIRGGWQLLPEVLVRLGFGSGRGAASSIRGRLPIGVRQLARAAIRGRARTRLQQAAGSLPHPLESPATRAASLDNSPCGAVRLNVKGRDLYGSIAPGREYDEACEELIAELSVLEDADTGAPAVEAVMRADELYGDAVHPNVPDLLVRFGEHGLLSAVRSPRVGTVSGPIWTAALPRSGDHPAAPSRLLVVDPDSTESRWRTDGTVLDLAPTVLRLLDVPLPEGLAGSPLALPAQVPA